MTLVFVDQLGNFPGSGGSGAKILAGLGGKCEREFDTISTTL